MACLVAKSQMDWIVQDCVDVYFPWREPWVICAARRQLANIRAGGKSGRWQSGEPGGGLGIG